MGAKSVHSLLKLPGYLFPVLRHRSIGPRIQTLKSLAKKYKGTLKFCLILTKVLEIVKIHEINSEKSTGQCSNHCNPALNFPIPVYF